MCQARRLFPKPFLSEPKSLRQHSCRFTSMIQVKPSPPVVLVVDDDEDLLVLLQLKLESEGFDPLCSPNGGNLMDIITQRHPDLVLLDIHMNGVDGGDLCRQIKSNPDTADITVVLFSANANIETVSRQCGADGFISKPFSSEKFDLVLNKISRH